MCILHILEGKKSCTQNKKNKQKQNIFPLCLLKNLEPDHLYMFHSRGQQAASEPLLRGSKMRNAESYWMLHFLSGKVHIHLAQELLLLKHTGKIQGAQWFQLPTPQIVCFTLCTQFGVVHKTRGSSFKT